MVIKLDHREQLGNRLLFLLFVALTILNTFLVVLIYSNLRAIFPDAAGNLGYKQEVALDLADYNRRLATELDVLDRNAVREALAGFNYEVDMATSSDELTQVILNEGRRAQEVILREADAKLMDQVLSVINKDENVRQAHEKNNITIRLSGDKVTVNPEGYLGLTTIYRIRQIPLVQRLTTEQVLNIEIAEGSARMMVPYNPIEHIQSLSSELDKLRVDLHELRVAAGLAEMTGPGVVLQLYDEVGGTNSVSIVHDADIRDVVNELFSSGAQGVSVGGQRLTASSSIRCSGSLIKVNDKLIPVNPVVIKAVGETGLLTSGLDIIRTAMEIQRGIKFEVTPVDSVTIPGYVRSAKE